MVELLLLMFEFEVLVYYWALQENMENMEQMGCGLRMRKSSMSVSEFKYAVYSGKTWNECVELDDELFLIEEGEGL